MQRPNAPMPSDQDDRLADFTDRVLRGQTAEIDPNMDDELRGLEETILRLHQSIPRSSLDHAAARQMQVRLNARMRKDGGKIRESSPWRFRLSPTNLRFGLMVAVVVLVLIFFVGPLFGASDSSTNATALNPSANFAVAILLAGAIIIIFRITRRK